MVKPHEKGCRECDHGWVIDEPEEGGAPETRPCGACRPDDLARHRELSPAPAEQGRLHVPPTRPEPEASRWAQRGDLA